MKVGLSTLEIFHTDDIFVCALTWSGGDQVRWVTSDGTEMKPIGSYVSPVVRKNTVLSSPYKPRHCSITRCNASFIDIILQLSYYENTLNIQDRVRTFIHDKLSCRESLIISIFVFIAPWHHFVHSALPDFRVEHKKPLALFVRRLCSGNVNSMILGQENLKSKLLHYCMKYIAHLLSFTLEIVWNDMGAALNHDQGYQQPPPLSTKRSFCQCLSKVKKRSRPVEAGWKVAFSLRIHSPQYPVLYLTPLHSYTSHWFHPPPPLQKTCFRTNSVLSAYFALRVYWSFSMSNIYIYIYTAVYIFFSFNSLIFFSFWYRPPT